MRKKYTFADISRIVERLQELGGARIKEAELTDLTADQVGRGIKGKSNGIVLFSTGLVGYPPPKVIL